MKKKLFIIIPAVIIVFAVVCICVVEFRSQPDVPVEFSMSVCSREGETAFLTANAAIVDNGIDPVHYRGSITIDGEKYIDHIERFYPANISVFDRLKERRRGVLYLDFHEPFYDKFGDWVEMRLFEDGGKRLVWLEFFPIGGDRVEFFGPAENWEEAQAVWERIEKIIVDSPVE